MVDPVLSGAFAPDPPPVGRSAQRDEIPRPGALSRRHTFSGFSVDLQNNDEACAGNSGPGAGRRPGRPGPALPCGPRELPARGGGAQGRRLPRREPAGRDTNSLVGVTLALERENKGATRLQEV